MLFEKLANGVVKHHRKVIAFWVIMVLLSIYPMTHMNDVVVYEEVGMAPENIEAKRASELIDAQFPSAVANSTVIVVLQTGNVRSADVRNFSMEFEEKVKGSKDLKYIQDFNSIYTAYEQAMSGFVNSTAVNFHATEDGVNQTATMFYGLPRMFLDTFNNTNFTASLVYGIPKFHMEQWQQTSGNNVTQRDDIAYANTFNLLKMSVSLGVFPASGVRLLFDYYNLTCEKWNETRFDPTYNNSPVPRAQKSVDDAVPGFADIYFNQTDARSYLYSVWKGWNVTGWYIELLNEGNNIPRLNEFSNRTVQDYMLMSGSGTDPVQMALYLAYHNQTMQYWANATKGFAQASQLNMTTMSGIMVADIWTNAPVFTNTTYANDPASKTFMFAILNAFSMDTWNNTALLHGFSLNTMKQNMAMMGLNLTAEFLESVYGLGDNPSMEELTAFSESIVENGTLDTYPMRLPYQVESNFISAKNDTMLIVITFTKNSRFEEKGFSMSDVVPKLRGLVSDTKMKVHAESLTTYVTGDLALSSDLEGEAFKDVEKIDPITVGLIIGLIAIFFMSFVTPFIPLAVMGVGIIVSQGILYVVGKFIAGIHYSVTTLLFVVLLGAGCDYCIFIIARYREERRGGRSREDAVRTVITWAGESIATSGVTVIIGFGALSVGSFSLMRTMGMVLALAIAVALLIALTLLPSIILLLGNRIFWPSETIKKRTWLDTGLRGRKRNRTARRGGAERGEHTGYFSNAARFSIRHAKAIVIVALLVTVPTTYAVLNFQSSFDFIATMPSTEGTRGMEAMGSGFGEGNIMKTYVVLRFPGKLYDGRKFDNSTLGSIDALCARIGGVQEVEKVEASTVSMGARIDKVNWGAYSEADKKRTLEGSLGKDNSTVLLTVVLKEEPFSKSSMNAIGTIRDIVRDAGSDPNLADATMLVGGSTAEMRDVQKVTDDDFQKMVVIVVIGIFIVLLIVLGSVLIPLRLILTISLSISWTLAMTILVFEYMRGIPLLWLMPMILFVVMMGLGMDYDIFLCTRMREEVSKGKSDVKAIVTAVEDRRDNNCLRRDHGWRPGLDDALQHGSPPGIRIRPLLRDNHRCHDSQDLPCPRDNGAPAEMELVGSGKIAEGQEGGEGEKRERGAWDAAKDKKGEMKVQPYKTHIPSLNFILNDS